MVVLSRPDIRSVPVRARLAQLRAFAWRFGTLALAHRLFEKLAPGVYRRRFFGRDLFVDVSRSDTQRLLFLDGERFLGEQALLRPLLRPGMRVADVGANIGYYLLFLESILGADGEIVCIEPDADNVEELRRNVAYNQLSNVAVLPAAAGAASALVGLRPGLNSAVIALEEGGASVPMVRLDDVLTGPVDFIKIDVEGYEGQVLEGAERVLSQQRPRLFVEIHPGLIEGPHSVDSILELLGAQYSSVEFFEPVPQDGLVEKVLVRYLGWGVRPIRAPEALLQACRAGSRERPFWAICTGAPVDRRADD